VSATSPAAVIVLAAGAGTRMKSSTPKVLHTIAGRTLVHHALEAARQVAPERIVVVVRHERDQVAAHIADIAPEAVVADQDEIPGTGRAVHCALDAWDGPPASGTILVTSGDVPLIEGATLRALAEAHEQTGARVTVLSAHVDDPTGYGRVVRGEDGDVMAIVEEKDATNDQRQIVEINTGIYAFDAQVLGQALTELTTDNAAGEVYLTDVIAITRKAGGSVKAIVMDDPHTAEGVNDRAQLAHAAAHMNTTIVHAWMQAGVSVQDPATTWIDADVVLEPDVTILPGTQLCGSTRVASGAVVGPDTTLTDVQVGEAATVTRTHGSDSVIESGASVGPFAYLRPGTHLSSGAKIGTFVETKQATIGQGAKVPHLSYVGDADVAEGSNIGAGTIFVNYDGVAKHRTSVGKHVKIGSDNTLVAPVSVGDGAYTGAGAVIREDVPAGALAMNDSAQRIVEGWVRTRRPDTASAEAAAAADENEQVVSDMHADGEKEG